MDMHSHHRTHYQQMRCCQRYVGCKPGGHNGGQGNNFEDAENAEEAGTSLGEYDPYNHSTACLPSISRDWVVSVENRNGQMRVGLYTRNPQERGKLRPNSRNTPRAASVKVPPRWGPSTDKRCHNQIVPVIQRSNEALTKPVAAAKILGGAEKTEYNFPVGLEKSRGQKSTYCPCQSFRSDQKDGGHDYQLLVLVDASNDLILHGGRCNRRAFTLRLQTRRQT